MAFVPPPRTTPPHAAPLRSPLRRPQSGRLVAGVAVGLAQHLGLSVRAVRWGFAISGLALAGVVLYLWLWLTVPSGDVEGSPAALTRLVPRLQDPVRRRPLVLAIGGLGLLVLAGVALASKAGFGLSQQWLLPGLILLGAVALAWSQLGVADAAHPEHRSVSVLRLIGALVLVVLGVTLAIGQDATPTQVLRAGLAGLAVLAGVGLVLAPWWVRLVGALGSERAARARESERADIAAHLHDSVLQTLTVIRSRADDPELVRRLARAQERELREWLYQDRTAPGTSLAAELKAAAGEVEDRTGVEVGMVLVGDAVPSQPLQALVDATREAMFNAARHGRAPVSLYGELGGDPVEVFVKDRGDGFDLAEVPTDRLGVRESILGRVRRAGGQAKVVSHPERGTEVRLTMPNPKE